MGGLCAVLAANQKDMNLRNPIKTKKQNTLLIASMKENLGGFGLIRKNENFMELTLVVTPSL